MPVARGARNTENKSLVCCTGQDLLLRQALYLPIKQKKWLLYLSCFSKVFKLRNDIAVTFYTKIINEHDDIMLQTCHAIKNFIKKISVRLTKLILWNWSTIYKNKRTVRKYSESFNRICHLFLSAFHCRCLYIWICFGMMYIFEYIYLFLTWSRHSYTWNYFWHSVKFFLIFFLMFHWCIASLNVCTFRSVSAFLLI